MRGLGPERTLVLFDGFRMPPADKRGSVNVDALPTALVRSVDVVTGGATAAYGADALGGVTNFILDREFQGLKLNAGTGMNEFDNEGKNWNMSVAGGTAHRRAAAHHRFSRGAARRPDRRATRPISTRAGSSAGATLRIPRGDRRDPPGTNPQRLTVPWVAPAGLHVNGKIALPPRVAAERARQHEVQRRRHRHRAVRSRATLVTPSATRGSPAALTRRSSNLTQGGGPNGAEVDQLTAFFEPEIRRIGFRRRLLRRARSATSSRTAVQSISGASMSGPWSPTVFRENAYLPASRPRRSWSRRTARAS